MVSVDSGRDDILLIKMCSVYICMYEISFAMWMFTFFNMELVALE